MGGYLLNTIARIKFKKRPRKSGVLLEAMVLNLLSLLLLALFFAFALGLHRFFDLGEDGFEGGVSLQDGYLFGVVESLTSFHGGLDSSFLGVAFGGLGFFASGFSSGFGILDGRNFLGGLAGVAEFLHFVFGHAWDGGWTLFAFALFAFSRLGGLNDAGCEQHGEEEGGEFEFHVFILGFI